MSSSDFRQRFVFDQLDVRGCVVRLEQTCEAIQATHHYPKPLANLLNQFALAATLLRDSIKIDGSLTIQLRSPGSINLLMADCMADRRIRAIAEYDSAALVAGDLIQLNDLGNNSTLTITISPEGGERYQSIVPIEHSSLAECLEDYFARSEQLPSLFSFHADHESAFGIALHALPPEKIADKKDSIEHFERLQALLKSLRTDEALTLQSDEILTRLFHQESCRLFDANAVEFGCICSSEKSLDAVKALGQEDIDSLIEEQKAQGKQSLVVDCHFCFQRYEFEFNKLTTLFEQ